MCQNFDRESESVQTTPPTRACCRQACGAITCLDRRQVPRVEDLAPECRVSHVPNPVAIRADVPDAGTTEPLVLFAARLIPEKRVTVGVAAVALAARRIEGLRGVFYGEGPEHEALYAAIAEHHAHSFISAPGFVPGDAVDADMRRALCVLLPSEREGYGMVVVEASAHATPAVVAAAPDNAAVELVQDGVNGVIALGADSEAIADAIVRVHEAGMGMRESSALWFAENAERLSLESSLHTVLDNYAFPKA